MDYEQLNEIYEDTINNLKLNQNPSINLSSFQNANSNLAYGQMCERFDNMTNLLDKYGPGNIPSEAFQLRERAKEFESHINELTINLDLKYAKLENNFLKEEVKRLNTEQKKKNEQALQIKENYQLLEDELDKTEIELENTIRNYEEKLNEKAKELEEITAKNNKLNKTSNKLKKTQAQILKQNDEIIALKKSLEEMTNKYNQINSMDKEFFEIIEMAKRSKNQESVEFINFKNNKINSNQSDDKPKYLEKKIDEFLNLIFAQQKTKQNNDTTHALQINNLQQNFNTECELNKSLKSKLDASEKKIGELTKLLDEREEEYHSLIDLYDRNTVELKKFENTASKEYKQAIENFFQELEFFMNSTHTIIKFFDAIADQVKLAQKNVPSFEFHCNINFLKNQDALTNVFENSFWLNKTKELDAFKSQLLSVKARIGIMNISDLSH